MVTDEFPTMRIDDSSRSSLLQSVLDARATRETISVAVLDKSQELLKQQGEAIINLLENAADPSQTRLLDVYA